MNMPLLFAGGLSFVPIMGLSGFVLMREMRRDERLAARVRMIHGQRPAQKSTSESEAIRAAIFRSLAAVGQLILRSGMVSARTLTELQNTLAASGLRGPQGVGVFIGAKIIAVLGFPALVWLLTRDLALPGMLHTILPPGAGVLGLVLPDWLIGKQRNRYLTRLQQGLPDALDMMVICTQAGLGLEAAMERVAEEIVHAHPELAAELAQTTSELRIAVDTPRALANLGTRTGLVSLKRVTATLAQTLNFGTPLTATLRVLAAEMRQQMLTRFEERAARLPVMLTLPMILFIFPCLFIVIGGPAVIQLSRAFAR
jgi:tight adherence protein C